ncbi:MAG: hypothetical protein KAI70_08285 [Candidatus Omnitrophica bacterium]|nr:hypothetical protein [Candidatus Omnitrophota bacterium]
MDTQYSSKDIIKMVIQAKTKGVDLYLTLARNSENYHVSNLFAELAKDGQRHKIQMEKWINSLDDVTREEAYPGEAALYLKALVDAGTFNCDAATKKALEMTVSEEEALQAGITFEKDFMLYLHDLKKHVNDEAKESIDSIIEDEIKHLNDFFKIKEKIIKG